MEPKFVILAPRGRGWYQAHSAGDTEESVAEKASKMVAEGSKVDVLLVYERSSLSLTTQETVIVHKDKPTQEGKTKRKRTRKEPQVTEDAEASTTTDEEDNEEGLVEVEEATAVFIEDPDGDEGVEVEASEAAEETVTDEEEYQVV